MYRGDILHKDVMEAVGKVKSKKKNRFVPWTPSGFKIGINHRMPQHVPKGDMGKVSKAVSMLANHGSIVSSMCKVLKKFDLMFRKRAFCHWFVAEGMEETEFSEGREALDTLSRDQEEIGIEVA